MPLRLQMLYQSVKTSGHLLTAMVLNDERHLILWMLLQLVEFPRMKISYEISIVLQHSVSHPIIQTLWQVVKSKPEQRETYYRSHGSRNLHHALFHGPCAGSSEMNISAWYASRIKR